MHTGIGRIGRHRIGRHRIGRPKEGGEKQKSKRALNRGGGGVGSSWILKASLNFKNRGSSCSQRRGSGTKGPVPVCQCASVATTYGAYTASDAWVSMAP